jgi:hypothetical protein
MFPDVFALLNVAPIRSFVGSPPRIYRHGVATSQSPAAPYITWSMVVGIPENHLDGTPPTDRMSIQVDCWSENTGAGSLQVGQLAQAVRNQIETVHDIESFDADLRDPETMRYRASMTFTWWADRPT